jgi:hypothetical protein
MVRFNVSKYTTPCDDEQKYKNKLKLISIFHNNAEIEKTISDKNIIIKVSSDSQNDFIHHFIKLKHSNIELNDDLKKVKNKLDDLIQKRLNNNIEIYYETIIYPAVSTSDIYKIINNSEYIYSYIFINNTFLICILDNDTKFTSIIEFTINKICDGWSPKFDLDDGFYDQWYKDLREKELKILNECYQDWLLNKETILFNNLQYL